MIECGIDEPYLMATDGEEGEIGFSAPPHFEAKKFCGKKLVSNKNEIIDVLADEEEPKAFSNLYSDILSSVPECGELFTLYPEYKEGDDFVLSHNLIYKAPILAVIDAAKELKTTKKNLTILFSVHKCLAQRGIRAYLSDNEENTVLSVGCSEIKENQGAIICAKEKSCVPTVRVRENLEKIAKDCGIEYSVKLFTQNYGLKNILITGCGAECGLLCIPFEKNSENGYKINKNDIKNVTKLLISYCKD